MQSEWKETARIVFIGAALLISADAQAGNFTLGIGADYASGKYGEPNKTEDLYVPVSLSYKTGRWRTRLVVPYIQIKGNGEVIGGPGDRLVDDHRQSNSGSGSSGSGGSGSSGSGGGQDDSQEQAEDANPATATATSRESGLGDVIGSLTYSVYVDETDGLYVDVTARIKFGTADETKGLGSGENDYGLHLDIDKDIGKATLSLGLGYTFIGDPPGFSYRNVVSASTGASYRITDAVSVSTTVSFRQSVRAGAPDQLDVSPGVGLKLGENQKVNAYLLFGLADGSPDFGGGVSYTYSF